MNGVSTSANPPAAERPIDEVRGTRDWLPTDFARLDRLESLLLDRFARAGYEPLRTPVLEPTELHERKSGAGIVSKLFELAGGSTGQDGVCLRPELTAGIVRAYTAAPVPPDLPWRVSHVGPVFRYETPRPGRLREFQQVGVERIGDAGPVADAEVIGLADWALAEAGVSGVTIRLGHVGLILEMLQRSGLPAPLAAALIERLSEAAAEGRGVRALELGLEQLAGWLHAGAGESEEMIPEAVGRADDGGIDRLFRTLVPVVTGRRSGHEIVHRLRRKWDLGHGLLSALERVRKQVHGLADLKGEPAAVLDRLGPEGEALAPDSVAALRALLRTLEEMGVHPSRVVLDLGFGRGIGFYSRMVFELIADTPDGPVEVCGGGRYDGLARVLGSDRDDRGVGFAFGLERLAGVLDAQGLGPSPLPPRGFLILAAAPGAIAVAARLAVRLRAAGARAVLETERGVDESLAIAEAAGIPRVVAVGVDEALTLHDLVALSESPCTIAQLERLAREEGPAR
jgi:histidyl-tRNA synthetase